MAAAAKAAARALPAQRERAVAEAAASVRAAASPVFCCELSRIGDVQLPELLRFAAGIR